MTRSRRNLTRRNTLAWALVLGGLLAASSRRRVVAEQPTSAALPAQQAAQPRDARGDSLREPARVLVALGRAARENAQRPEPREARRAAAARLDGDALGDYYVRRAARAALDEADHDPGRAFAVALGFALDDTGLLAHNPVFGWIASGLETPAARRTRLERMGLPSLRGRHDWLLHFAVSGSLAALSGPAAAEALGLQKEIQDARGKQSGRGSGFSFGDLAADYAGLELARYMLAEPEHSRAALRILAEDFRGDRFLPDLSDAEEGLTYDEFTEKYGTTADARFLDISHSLRERVRACSGWRLLRDPNDGQDCPSYE